MSTRSGVPVVERDGLVMSRCQNGWLMALLICALFVWDSAWSVGDFGVDAEPILPLTISNTQDMDFGTVVRGSSDTLFEISRDGGVDINFGDGFYLSGAHPGSFSIDGDEGEVVLVQSGIDTDGCDGPNDAVNLQSVTPYLQQVTLPLTLDVTGSVLVKPSAEGSYTCHYRITADYMY